MPNGFRIDGELGVILVRFWGAVDVDELDLLRRQIEEAPGFRAGLDRLWDERTCQLDLTRDDLVHLAAQWEANDELHGDRRLAYLVTRDLAWGFNRQFESFRDSDSLDVDIAIFRDYSEALRWLGLPPDLPNPADLIPDQPG